MNDRTLGARDLQPQDKPLPGEPWEKTRFNTRISQVPNFFGSHVGSGPPKPLIDHIHQKIHKNLKNSFHFHIDNHECLDPKYPGTQLSLTKGETMFPLIPTGFRKGAIFVPILGNLRGSVGANTFSHNRGGDYIRRRVAPTNPNSTRQQTMRTLLSGLASYWGNSLTDVQRAGWNTWAAQQPKEGPLGNSINLSGINGFIWCNCHILDAGDTQRDTPPVFVAPPALDTFSVDISALNTADVTFTGTPLAGGMRIALFMSLPQSGKAEPNFKQCRIVGYSDLAETSPWAATLPFGVQVSQGAVFFAAQYDRETGLFSGFLRATDFADY